MTFIKTALCAATMSTGLATTALSEQLPAPRGEVLLTLSGAVQNETADGVVTLDLDMLKAMGTAEFTTSTIWLEEEATFTGVALRDLLNYAGATGSTVTAIALNDYEIEIPVAEIEDDTPIVAYWLNGEEMPSRGKGPLWIVYPYDQNTAYQSEVVYSRSIWQLDRIVSSD